MTTDIYMVDAFSSLPFRGNPAAVCLMDEPRDEMWMQEVAAEMNLSETAFLHREQGDDYRLRWFTPLSEVDLCGHATLASAHVLWETGLLDRRHQARFHSNSGLLTADKQREWIEMNFPSEPAEAESVWNDLIEKALRTTPLFIGRNRLDFIVEVQSEVELRHMQPDFQLLKQLPARGIIVTAGQSANGYDFVSRCFYPAVGVNEDPVTGSAHCCLAPYWAAKRDQAVFKAYQASKRGGELLLRLVGERVYIAGQAITVMKSKLLV